MADESSAVTTAAPPQATNAATPGVRATAASLEPSLPALLNQWGSLMDRFARPFCGAGCGQRVNSDACLTGRERICWMCWSFYAPALVRFRRSH